MSVAEKTTPAAVPVRLAPNATAKRLLGEARERDLAVALEEAEAAFGRAVGTQVSEEIAAADSHLQKTQQLHRIQVAEVKRLLDAEAEAEATDAGTIAQERADEKQARSEQIIRRAIRMAGFARQAFQELQAIEQELGPCLDLSTRGPAGAAYGEWRQQPYLFIAEVIAMDRIADAPVKLRDFLARV